jgi:L-cystine transport system ATP-binding protein
VGIARALALNPELILFDEPTSALDPETVGDVLDVIRDVANSGATMIITTHEMSFAYEIADRIVFMEKGVVVESGTPDEVFHHPKQQRTKEFLSRYVQYQPEYVI